MVSTDVARHNLAAHIPDGPWLHWASQLIPTLTIEAVIAWLDADQPDPEHAADRISRVVHGVIDAAQADQPDPRSARSPDMITAVAGRRACRRPAG